MTAATTSARVELEISMDAPREEVWRCLVADIAAWWPKEFYVSDAKDFILEPHVGGHMYEDAGDGTGMIWFKVTGFMPPEKIFLEGHIQPPWGGPCASLITLSLEEDGEQTVFKLHDHLFGVLQTTDTDSLSKGWKQIFEDGFKEYVEKSRS